MCTIDAFNALSRDNKQRIVKFLQQTLTYAEISIGETDYVLTHDESYYDDPYGAILITGHTPTRYYDENPNPDFIWRDGDHYHIDCGCGYGGQLGALCLEMDAEFYV
jgi:serine/threonine protein phosphatase 1